MDSEPIRLLHCIPSLAGGGAERQLCYLAAGLIERGQEVHIAYVKGGENMGLLERTGAKLHRLEASSSFDPRLVIQLLNLMRDLRPTIVQTWLLQMDVVGGLAAKLLDIPFILSERANESVYKHGLKYWLRRQLGGHAAAVVANSPAGLAYWRGRKRHLDCVISNGVPINASVDVQPLYLNDNLMNFNGSLLLYVGRFQEEKNVDLLVQALMLVTARNDETRALLLGEGPLRQQLERRVADARLSDRVVVGPYAANAREWMRRADRFILVSPCEGHPNVVIEAALEGCPVILSSIPPHRDMFTEAEALFVNHLDAEDLAIEIQSDLENPSAAGTRAAAAHARSAGYTIPKMVSSYQALYVQLATAP